MSRLEPWIRIRSNGPWSTTLFKNDCVFYLLRHIFDVNIQQILVHEKVYWWKKNCPFPPYSVLLCTWTLTRALKHASCNKSWQSFVFQNPLLNITAKEICVECDCEPDGKFQSLSPYSFLHDLGPQKSKPFFHSQIILCKYFHNDKSTTRRRYH